MGWNISKGTILLYYPEISYIKTDGLHRVPYSILNLSGPLVEAGYEVKLFDARVDNPEILSTYLKSKPLFVGISSLIGQQLRGAINFAKYIRSFDKSIPIVWGGWAASLIPENIIQESYADIVAKGQFEHLIVNLVDDIANNKKSCPGVLWKEPEGIIDTGLDSLPLKFGKIPWEMIDLDKYGPYFGYLTSFGCYETCRFCCLQVISKHKYVFRDIDEIINDLKYIFTHKKSISHLNIDDDEWFFKKSRVMEFCEKWIKTGYNFVPISILVHVRAALTYSDEMYLTLAQAGIKEILIGAESGNQIILDRLKKHQTKDNILQFVEKITKFGMVPDLSTMTGFPDSDELEDFKDTILMLQEAHRINPYMKFKLFYIRPYPGSKLYDDFKKQGYKMPQTLKEWSEYTLRYVPPWCSREISDMINFFMVKFLPEHGWEFKWDYFINQFWKCREKDEIPIQRGM
jgi:radical SAM superfamily enzyme YgiQ (UPF0313 family)